MSKVAVVGYGSTNFTKENISIESLLLESTKQVFDTTRNISQSMVDGVIVSTNDNSKYLGAILSELTGIKPKITHTVEHLCSSGSSAVISAYSYIASGLADIVLVVDEEKPKETIKKIKKINPRAEWIGVLNKIDLKRKISLQSDFQISCTKNSGIGSLLTS